MAFHICQKLNGELQDALEDREALKTQVQQYILEVRRTEDLLSTKVSLHDMLINYKTLKCRGVNVITFICIRIINLQSLIYTTFLAVYEILLLLEFCESQNLRS